MSEKHCSRCGRILKADEICDCFIKDFFAKSNYETNYGYYSSARVKMLQKNINRRGN